MPRDLFGDVISPRVSVNGKKWYTVPLSLVAHVAVIVPLVLATLTATDSLPAVREYIPLAPGDVIPPEPPPPPRETREVKPRPNPNAAPLEAPENIAPESVTPAEVSESVDFGVLGGVPGSGVVMGEPPPPPPPAPVEPKPVRAGAEVQPPVKLRDQAPIYPLLARRAGLKGTVILEATIATDGRVQNVRVLRSIPLLDQAAIDAVRQWEYSPTLLNGVPVPVIMTVTVTFTLNRE